MTDSGVYLHIPFCRSRCSYCDFATGIYDADAAERYVKALVREISGAEQLAGQTIDTIYFGGGTPSLLSTAQVAAALDAVFRSFSVAPNAEITMEMNPGTVTPESLREWRVLGINRASFGAQTFDDAELRRLGRSHTAGDARRTFELLRAADFGNVNLDLIAGLPAQTLAAWERNLEEALRLRPEHLSLYLLEIHEGTPLAEQIRRGRSPRPSDDAAAEMYRLMIERVGGSGYEHYEISNFCLPGRESRHNSKYWTGAPVYGFGCSAHSFDGARRRWSNERDPLLYVRAIEGGRSPIVESVELDRDDLRAEAFFLGLRLMRGVDVGTHRERFGCDVRETHAADLARLKEAGLIELRGDTLKLTGAGALLSNEVFTTFL